MSTKKIVNRRLKDKYGCDADGSPHWRVVFANEEFEKRYGHFNDYDGKIFVRTVMEERIVPKYAGPDFEGMWILEKLVPIPDIISKELCGLKRDYFCCWVLKTKNGVRLPLSWKAIDAYLMIGMGATKFINAPAAFDKEEKERYKRIKEFRDMWDDNHSFLSLQLKHGEAITVPEKVSLNEDVK